MLKQPIVIDNFQKGIAQSPLFGFQDIRCIDLQSYPGYAVTEKKSKRSSYDKQTITLTFTANSSTDVCTASSNISSAIGNYTGTDAVSQLAVTFSTTGTLPTGISPSTIYFINSITSNTFKISTTVNNSENTIYIDITGTGSGVHTLTPIVPKLIKYFTTSSVGNLGLDEDGRLWYDGGVQDWTLIPGNSITAGTSLMRGIVSWKGYVFVWRTGNIDVLTISTYKGAPTWSNAWASGVPSVMVDGLMNGYNPIVGQDDIIYFCQGYNSAVSSGRYYIGSISEKDGQVFAPGTIGTFNLNGSSLDLPYCPTSLTESNKYLVIGTTTNKVYYWDRVSSSFNFPVTLPEDFTYSMQGINGKVFCLTGNKGIIYLTDGTSSVAFSKLPQSIVGGSCLYFDSDYTNNLIFFTAQCTSGSFICSVDTRTGELQIKGKPSGGYSSVVLGSIFSIDYDDYFFSWRFSDSSNYSIDSTNTTYYDNYDAMVISQIYKVAPSIDKLTLNSIDVELGNKLTAGQGFKIYFRENFSDSWSQILPTIDYATYNDIKSFNFEFSETVESLQIKIEMTGYVMLKNIYIN